MNDATKKSLPNFKVLHNSLLARSGSRVAKDQRSGTDSAAQNPDISETREGGSRQRGGINDSQIVSA